MKLPTELILNILEIKSNQAWKSRLSKIHTVLKSIIPTDYGMFYFRDQEVFHLRTPEMEFTFTYSDQRITQHTRATKLERQFPTVHLQYIDRLQYITIPNALLHP